MPFPKIATGSTGRALLTSNTQVFREWEQFFDGSWEIGGESPTLFYGSFYNDGVSNDDEQGFSMNALGDIAVPVGATHNAQAYGYYYRNARPATQQERETYYGAEEPNMGPLYTATQDVFYFEIVCMTATVDQAPTGGSGLQLNAVLEGGTAPFTYVWDFPQGGRSNETGAGTSQMEVTRLPDTPNATYHLTVTDADGCEAIATGTLETVEVIDPCPNAVMPATVSALTHNSATVTNPDITSYGVGAEVTTVVTLSPDAMNVVATIIGANPGNLTGLTPEAVYDMETTLTVPSCPDVVANDSFTTLADEGGGGDPPDETAPPEAPGRVAFDDPAATSHAIVIRQGVIGARTQNLRLF